MKLEAKEIMKIHVTCEKDMEVKDDGSGYLRVIPIVGGTFEGEVNGTIVPGGADWNVAKANGISHVFAKYVLKTDDGEYIAIENDGKIDFCQSDQRIRTVPRFQIDEKSKYAWLNYGVYVGELHVGNPNGLIEIVIHKLL